MSKFIVSREIKLELGKMIKFYRERKNYSFLELSRLTSINETYLQLLERGEVVVINPLILKEIGYYLGLNYLRLYNKAGFVENLGIINYFIGDDEVYEKICIEIDKEKK